MRARVSRAKFEKGRPSRRLRSEAGSKSRAENGDVTEASPELREHQPPSPLRRGAGGEVDVPSVPIFYGDGILIEFKALAIIQSYFKIQSSCFCGGQP